MVVEQCPGGGGPLYMHLPFNARDEFHAHSGSIVTGRAISHEATKSTDGSTLSRMVDAYARKEKEKKKLKHRHANPDP